ncbi:MAG: polyprenyl synthetase family protein [Candidatus Saccharibacteria bacterium]
MPNLKQKLIKFNQLVEPVIDELLTCDVEARNIEVALHQIKSGGKRIRPALVIISGQIFGCKVDDLLYPAAAIEILHNSTLIVDDIIDHSLLRRDVPTTWNKYGKSIAQCTSFMYIASVFAGLSHANNSPKLIDLYSNTLKVIIDGEIKDILFERSGRDDENFVVENRYKVVTKSDYLEMIGQKTAVLLQACCQAGAICAGASDAHIKAVGEFGFNLGMAFQIRDDILDIFGDEKEFGKKIGKDIIEKKMGNYVILSAIKRLDDKDKSKIMRLLESQSVITDQDVMAVTKLIKKTDAYDDAEVLAGMYIDNALKTLDKLPQNESNTELREIAHFVIERNR